LASWWVVDFGAFFWVFYDLDELPNVSNILLVVFHHMEAINGSNQCPQLGFYGSDD
jgi:hypothetical protein